MGLGPGETFGRYRIEEVLGAGGMGRVVAAHDTVLERPVALKVILPERASRDEAVARFFREAKLAARLNHPNTIRIYDLGEHEGTVFIVMERINGASLRERVGKGATVAQKLQWLLEVARGLHAAHAAGLVHRDVKPSNVMIDEHDVAKVVDFGLAKRFTMTPEQRATFHTRLGFVVGTPSFIAPEMLLEMNPDGRADMFAWGVTAYSVLSGRDPRANDPAFAGQRIALDTLVPELSPTTAKIVERALAWDRDDRFASMEFLASELSRAILPAAAPPPRPVEVRRVTRYCPVCASALPDDGKCARCRFGGRASSAPAPPRELRIAEELVRAPVGQLRAAAVDPKSTTVVAFGDAGIGVFEGGAWRIALLSGLKKPWVVRCAYFADARTIVWGGLDGRVARYSLDSGAGERLVTGTVASETTFTAVDGGKRSCVLAGASRDGHGVVVHVDGSKVEVRTSTRPLVGIARATDGTVWVCGDGGLLGPLDGNGVPRPIAGLRVGFRSVVAVGGEVFAGGTQGIMHVDRTGRARLDVSVQRVSVLVANGEEVWAGTTDGGIFLRAGTSWRELHKGDSAVLALHVGASGLTAVLANGTISRGAFTS